MRNSFLCIVVVLLAGCLGSPPTSSTSGSPTSTSAFQSCDLVDRTTDDGSSEVTPMERPTWRATSSIDAVTSFVESFEKTFAWNTALHDRIQSATIDVFSENVSQVDDGYVLILDVEHGYEEDITIDDGTPIRQAADDWYTAAYFINDTVLRRSVTRSSSAQLDPKNGSIIRCDRS